MNNIKCERRIYNFKTNTHAHEYGQLILPLHGVLSIETDYKKLKLNDDSVFFLPPDCKHTFNSYNNNEFLVLDIPNSMLNKYDMEKMCGGRNFLFDDKWKAIRYLLLNENNINQNSSSINNLFLYFYNFIITENLPNSIKYINEHFTEDIDLKKLAGIEHYNVSYYSEWFKHNMNISPTEYIQNLRVKRAKELLLNTNLTILQISQMIGYEHNSSFTKVFKNSEKISPAEFRKRIKK
ncbi:HTH-type transcriptional regulator YesS [Clostridium puniceum]|uniref:HTH-type transcriptional regulator YesS n=1 Tax=Clostridium puniceum TaxID=29367 RepID=A0A1S8TCU4_9CLOT|nr:AraC family transcriptional regulator [Clostridium puniceum]OOM75431.1 HTH-type transcriptional regulator YesS [Clostridium puniceum]